MDQTRQAAGCAPLTCPPLTASTFPVEQLTGRDLIYFDLHGLPRADFWQGDGGAVALEAWQIRSVNLSGAVVFATNCYLGDDHSPMLTALLEAGAAAVVAGGGRNWLPRSGLAYGAGLLGLWVRRMLAAGHSPERALEIAKVRVQLTGFLNREATVDTLAFRLFTA
jgi:hypothetical protein